jgi:protein-tyrosine phosphatase
MEMELVGAIKVKDGLFVGDEFAAQDLEFVVANKVSHVVNCAARQVPSHWEPIGVNYLSFYWLEHDSQMLFDNKDDAVNRLYSFIDKALLNGESVLIHSVRGQGRCICVAAVYLMKKFRWALQKTLEFLASRRPDIEIRPSFMQQLIEVERRLVKQSAGASSNWNELSEEMNLESEELLLRNTFMNARMGALADYTSPVEQVRAPHINWTDNGSGDPAQLTGVPHLSSKNPVEQGFAILRSCLKGGNKSESRVPIYGSSIGRGRPEKPRPVAEIDSKLREDLEKLSVQIYKRERPLSAGKKESTPVKK